MHSTHARTGLHTFCADYSQPEGTSDEEVEASVGLDLCIVGTRVLPGAEGTAGGPATVDNGDGDIGEDSSPSRKSGEGLDSLSGPPEEGVAAEVELPRRRGPPAALTELSGSTLDGSAEEEGEGASQREAGPQADEQEQEQGEFEPGVCVNFFLPFCFFSCRDDDFKRTFLTFYIQSVMLHYPMCTRWDQSRTLVINLAT